MKVYRVKSDVNHYRWLIPEETGEELLILNTFDCCSRKRSWRPPYVSALDPALRMGDFLYYHPSVLLSSPNKFHMIRPFFVAAGELLPLWFEGDPYTLLNITECIHALDESKTEWLRAPDGSKVEIRQYSFNPNMFTDSSLFKIPETCKGTVLTWEKDGNPENEFKAFVEVNGLTGLLFDKLWDSANSK